MQKQRKFEMLGMGIYTIAEAARYTNAHAATVRSWFSPRGENRALFLSDFQDTQWKAISFHDLVDVRMAAELRKKGLSMQTVRAAYRVLQEKWEIKHPFCSRKIYIHDKRLFVGLSDTTETNVVWDVLASQAFSKAVMEPFLSAVTFDEETELAAMWEIADGVVLDPCVRMGEPVIENTRIPASVLAGAFRAEGNNADFVADTYGISPDKVMAAVKFQRAFEKKAAA